MSDTVDAQRQLTRNKSTELRQALSREIRNIQKGVDALSEHRQATDNPHQTTKDHLGLRYVENYPMATGAEIRDGATADRYVRPTQLPEAFETHAPETTVNLYIGTPAIELPLMNAKDVAINPTIQARAYTYVDGRALTFLHREYEIIEAGGDWSIPIARWTQTDDAATTSTVALDYLGVYQVRVRDVAQTGEVSDWSLPVTFTVKQ